MILLKKLYAFQQFQKVTPLEIHIKGQKMEAIWLKMSDMYGKMEIMWCKMVSIWIKMVMTQHKRQTCDIKLKSDALKSEVYRLKGEL